MLMSKDKIIKFEFLFILFLICIYNLDKIENAVQDLVKLYEGNICCITRQFPYSKNNNNTIDTVLSINGIPLFAFELKHTTYPSIGIQISENDREKMIKYHQIKQ